MPPFSFCSSALLPSSDDPCRSAMSEGDLTKWVLVPPINSKLLELLSLSPVCSDRVSKSSCPLMRPLMVSISSLSVDGVLDMWLMISSESSAVSVSVVLLGKRSKLLFNRMGEFRLW